MAKGRKLAPGSLRDSKWQAKEYERLMGKEAAERQERLAAIESGGCVCHRRTIRTRGGYRTIHEPSCVKYKEWMAEHQPNEANQAARDAMIRSIRGG